MDSDIELSPTLLNNVVGSSPNFGKPMVYAINSASINTSGASHNVPPWMQLSSNLTQALISRLHPKWGISIWFNILDFSSPSTHVCASISISHMPGMLLVHN
jgi:hypothetical protein